MSDQGKKHHTGCLVAYGTDIFGDRWSLLVIRDMLLHGRKTYGEFLEAGEEIATNVLALRLRHLEAEGVIEKRRDPDNGRSYIYNLTDKGLALAPVILEIVRWSGKYTELDPARQQLVERIEADCSGLLTDLTERARSARAD